MNPESAGSPRKWKGDGAWIVFFQFLLPISFTIAMTGIIVWILSLILLARRLHDVPSASIGISLVAIPVFLILLGVFWYVFLGIVLNREEQSEEEGSKSSEDRLKEREN